MGGVERRLTEDVDRYCFWLYKCLLGFCCVRMISVNTDGWVFVVCVYVSGLVMGVWCVCVLELIQCSWRFGFGWFGWGYSGGG